MGGKTCPKCGGKLNLNGLYPVCGYKAPFSLDDLFDNEDIFFDNDGNPWHVPKD